MSGFPHLPCVNHQTLVSREPDDQPACRSGPVAKLPGQRFATETNESSRNGFDTNTTLANPGLVVGAATTAIATAAIQTPLNLRQDGSGHGPRGEFGSTVRG